MWPDVIDLRDFYASGPGQVARRMIRQRLRQMWPDVRGQRLLGLGYATPYLRDFRSEAERICALMPAPQGVLHWPPEGPNVTALVEESELPLPDLSIDRVVLIHALEFSEQLRPMLREVWRVMAAGGRLIAVVPNRRGIWARFDHTPFGHGHPYTAPQLSRLLRDNMFAPVTTARALFMPPFRRWRPFGYAAAWEKAGFGWFERFGGVLLIEASKQLYAPHAVKVNRLKQLQAYLPSPASAPQSRGG